MVLSIKNNNPGNLRPVGASDGFQMFATPQEGLEAMKRDLALKIAGNSDAMAGRFGQGYRPTLSNLINTWAPPTENNTNSYVDFVAKNSGLAPDAVLTEQDIDKIMPAMIELEGGQEAADYFLRGGQGQDNLIDIEMPDGTVIEGVPADMSKAQILERLKANGINVADFEQTVTFEGTENSTAEPKEADDFFSRTGRDLSRRSDIMSEIYEANQTGEQTPLESLFQAGGNIIGGGLDILGQGIYSGMEGLSYLTPDTIEQPLKDTGAEALRLVGQLPTFGGGTLGENLPGEIKMLSDRYDEFAEENPRAARNLNALGNYAQVFPVGKAGGMVTKGVVKTADVTGDAAVKVSKILKKSPTRKGLMTSEEVAKSSSQYYKAADEAGGMIKADRAFDMFDKMAKEVLPTDPKDLKAVSKETYVKTLDELQEAYLGSPLSLENLINIDRRLTGDAQKLVTSDPNARRLIKRMQSVVRETMAEASPDDMVGGQLGFKLYKEGTKLYAKSKRMKKIEDIVAHSLEAPQPSTAIKNGLRTLRKQIREGKVKGYTKAEIKMLDKAISSAGVEGLLRMLGSRFTSGVAAGVTVGTGFNPVALAASGGLLATSKLARAGAESIKKKKVNKLLRQIQGDNVQSLEALKQFHKGAK